MIEKSWQCDRTINVRLPGHLCDQLDRRLADGAERHQAQPSRSALIRNLIWRWLEKQDTPQVRIRTRRPVA